MIDNDKCEAYKRIIKIEEDLIRNLLSENKKLRDCVEYYADLGDECIGYDVRGVATARKALKEITPIE